MSYLETWVMAEEINAYDKNAAMGLILALWSKIQKFNSVFLNIKDIFTVIRVFFHGQI